VFETMSGTRGGQPDIVKFGMTINDEVTVRAVRHLAYVTFDDRLVA